jgi:hypothetical protein
MKERIEGIVNVASEEAAKSEEKGEGIVNVASEEAEKSEEKGEGIVNVASEEAEKSEENRTENRRRIVKDRRDRINHFSVGGGGEE